MNIKEGSYVEYPYKGQFFLGRVEAVLWLGSYKARITPQVKGHPTTLPVKDLTLIKEPA